jgi:hypothetical protein
LQLPDAPLVKQGETAAQNTTPVNLPPPAGASLAFTPAPAPPPVKAAENKPVVIEPSKPPVAQDNKSTVAQNNKSATVEDLPSFVPAPKSLISDQAAATVATVNTGNAGTQNAVLTALPKAAETSAVESKPVESKVSGPRVAKLSLLPQGDVIKVGEKRRYAIQLNSDVPLSLALLAFKFDPKVLKVQGLTAGTILPTTGESAPLFTPSIDASGTCLISISSLNGKASFKGSGPLLFIDVEAIGAGDAALVFVKETLHLVATDARDVVSEVVQGRATVKQ